MCRIRWRLVAVLIVVGACARPVPPAASGTPASAFDVVAEVDRLAAAELWPGFDPRVIPLAIYDGERTLLFRHPSPPPGFEPLPGRPGVSAYTGRHPAVTANTSIELGGAGTATLMPLAGEVSLRERAAVLIHEAFHVFQRERHPAWSANEVDLFVYPVDNPGLLALRRLESEALRRALLPDDDGSAACWAQTALDARRERFAGLPPGSVAYERGTELNEGLATYVEQRASGERDRAALPAAEFAPEAVRQRGYATGLALARLLDRLSSSWRSALERRDSTSLDALLASALATGANASGACGFRPGERDSARVVASRDVDALRVRRAQQRREFLQQPGWQVVITSDSPLFPQGFDPLNVHTVGQGEVMHTRWVKLGNAAGTVEVLGRPALTRAAGDHPLFNGIRELTITGLPDEPSLTEANGVVTFRAEGLSGELRGARVSRAGQTITIQLAPGP